MVLTFTCTISVSNAGKQEVGELLWAALGCNLAWGIVDAIMYLMDELINRARSVKQINLIKGSENISESRSIIRENISPLISELMEDKEIDRMAKRIKLLPELPVRKTLVFKNFLVAGLIFMLVFLVTLPVALPFLFINDVALAMRISNGVALVLMFAGGFTLARYSGLRPVLTALAYSAIGIILVALTVLLGG
jgi:VIT1/CCC1 family predicted Fe2+/Mn2+ transporter